MNRKLGTIAFLSALAMSGNALADGWSWAPFKQDGWKPEFTLAGVVGSMNPDNGNSDQYTGGELSLNCPWFQPPTGSIRQQFNIGYYNQDNMSVTSFEMNPNYFVSIGKGWTVGAGPGIGYVRAVIDDQMASLSSFQLSTNLNYRSGHFFAGLGARYQDTRDKEIAPGKFGADNWLVAAKFGINF
ncbi:MAG: hypothetical protein Q8O37_03240 [Sulfuricellaceae bacterium]|nr:hypothetical protein [Sulfuricellaceae bacterium]